MVHYPSSLNGMARQWTSRRQLLTAQETSFSVVDDKEYVDGQQVGTYGILKSYSQATPYDKYPPVNYQMYKPILAVDQMMRRDAPGNP